MSEQTASSYPLEDGDGNIIYPPTLTSVVFDENSKRLDTVLANIPRLGKIDPEPVDTIPRDADTLGGHAPDYFATNDSLSAINDKIGKQYSEFNSTVLNNLKTNGMYTGYFVSGATTSTGWGFLLVGGQGTSVVVQTALVSNGKQYTRYFYNNAWTAWT